MSVDWSRDGRRIVFAAVDSTDQDDLYTVASDGSGLRRISKTFHRSENYPRWSSDDSRILFRSYSGSPPCEAALDSVAADGTDRRQVRVGCAIEEAAWSPSGRRVLVQRARNQGLNWPALWTMALDGTRRVFIERGSEASYRPRR
jgi:Tol biopolymer transport system component